MISEPSHREEGLPRVRAGGPDPKDRIDGVVKLTEARAGYRDEVLARPERSMTQPRANPSLSAAYEELGGEAPGSSTDAN